MKKIVLIFLVFVSVACKGQVPGIGGFIYPLSDSELVLWNNISTANYDNKTYANSTIIQAKDVVFNTDGTIMYIIDSYRDRIYQHALSTAWNISTTSYVKDISIATQATVQEGLFFKPDGTKMYIVDSGTDYVYQYSLSTAWDIATATYDNKSLNVGYQDLSSMGIFFNSSGNLMYICGTQNSSVYQYSLSTSWDISTASHSKTLAVSVSSVNDLFFKPDGNKIYIADKIKSEIYQYSLSTAWDISTMSYDNDFFSVYVQEYKITGMFFHPDGTNFYIIGDGYNDVFQYSF